MPSPLAPSTRHTALLCAALLCSVPFAVGAQSAPAYTAERLIEKNLQARGGADKLRAIVSMRSSGLMRFGSGIEGRTVTYRLAPDRIRFEFSLQGLTSVSAWDGREAWSIQPFQGRRDPQKFSADDAKSMIRSADIAGPLLDWKAKGHRVEYLGTEDIDGTDAHKVRVLFADGDSRMVYLDPDHFLEIRIEEHQLIRGQKQVSVIDLGEYAQVGGVYFPFEQGPSQLESIELNVPTDPALFAFPTATR